MNGNVNTKIRLTIQPIFVGFLLCVLMLPPGVFAQTAPKPDVAAFGRFYQSLLKESGIIGSSCLVVQDGKIIDRQFLGSANQEKQQAVDEDTIFHWASITKTFTAIAIMQLRDRGKLKLDDPIAQYVPELAKVRNQ
jgi:CubicO group peptidase (beta-lactamase class C family)